MPSLTPFHTFGLPANCSQLIEIESIEQLLSVDVQEPFCLLGEGSNTVFLDDFCGRVLVMRLKGVEIEIRENETRVLVAAGENWHKLVTDLIEKGIPGLENLALIPGTVGAAPVQNIGAYGVELAQFIDYVEGVDLQTKSRRRLNASECQFGYRDSIFKHELKARFVITKVALKLSKQWQPVLNYGPLQSLADSTPTPKQVMDAVIATRQSKLPDPSVLPNSGSFFKNPIVALSHAERLRMSYPSMPTYPVNELKVKLAAGWLIEQAGLKGFSINSISVYEKQALVLVNDGQGTGAALIAMIKVIQQKVQKQFGVELEHEVRLMGEYTEVTI
ncbi:UDP-N-acetylenolpyruvoylglucosamine reductase [Pseudoalteromonas luteoviolacea B = ATCC 29581]|nr:UDP-N-acetylenolpyruvoylglucosamine reductase [Pseudoalteromonas luteoviolacea B = ATCC 29581]